MTPRSDIVFLSLELGLEEVAGELRRTWRTRVPVYRENRDNIVGILHARDLLAIDMADWVRSGTGVESLLREPLFVPESKPVTELLHAFRDRKLSVALVVDEFGGARGIVFIEDIMEEIWRRSRKSKTPGANRRRGCARSPSESTW